MSAAYSANYIENFGVEQLSKETKKLIGIFTNICWIQAYNSIMCGYFCIGFIDIMLKGRNLPDYANLFFLKEYEKNDKIVLK